MHTKKSPSQGKRIVNCSGAIALCEALPPHQRNVPSQAAKLGTCAHALVEFCLANNCRPQKMAGRLIRVDEDKDSVSILKLGAKLPRDPLQRANTFEVDEDMISGTTVMVDYVRDRLHELGVTSKALQLETRTNPLPDRVPDDTSGTADVTIDVWPIMLEVVDYKNGWNLVDHNDNEQLFAYLLGKALESNFAHEKYRITVVQPNAPHEEGATRFVEATKKELLEFQARYRKGVERSDEAEAAKNAPRQGFDTVNPAWAKKYLKAGDWCLFCDAKPRCPSYADRAQEAARADFDDEPYDIPLPETRDDILRLVKWGPFLEKLISAATMYVQRDLEYGYSNPDFKLVRKKTNRTLIQCDESVLVVKITKRFGVKREALFTKPALKSGPQIEKLIPAKRRKEFNDSFLVKPEGDLTLVPISDPRPAVLCKAGDDFDDEYSNDFDFG